MESVDRKEKSMGVLVTNFLKLCNREDVGLIVFDESARKLGVAHKRLYDVVDVLESIGLISRTRKNYYSWNGFGQVPRTLSELKEEGMKEKSGIIPCVTNSEMVLDKEDSEESSKLDSDDQEQSPSPKLDNVRCLRKLAHDFVKFSLCYDDDLIALDTAREALVNECEDPKNRRTKYRRLYDILNVFSSINVIKRTQIPGTKKPAYRWLGSEAILENKFRVDSGSLCDLNEPSICDLNEPKKRESGTQADLSVKRTKTDGSKDSKQYENQNTSSTITQEECDLELNVKNSSSGPSSTPGDTSEMNNVENILLSSTFQHVTLDLLGNFGKTDETRDEEYR